MFDQMKDMGKLLKQAKEMRSKMKDVQKQLKKTTVTGRDNKNWVEVVLTGELDCTSVQITANEAFDPKNKSELEKSLLQAFNNAAKASKEIASKQLSEVSGGMNIPGLT